MSNLIVRFVFAILFSLFGFVQYCSNTAENPVTGEEQRVRLSPEDEIALGLEARDSLAQQHGGLYPNARVQRYVDAVGERIVEESSASESPYPFEFHVLNDPQTVNAFALPGGQVFITSALLSRMSNEAQLAGVLGHEITHVVARHGAEHLAKQQLGNFLMVAVGVAASEDGRTAQQAQILAQVVNSLVSLQYGRADESESDRWGFEFMTEAGYDPNGIVEVMEILQAASGGGGQPEFLSSHPNPGNRIQTLEDMIDEAYPQGVPAQLETGADRFESVVNRLPGGN